MGLKKELFGVKTKFFRQLSDQIDYDKFLKIIYAIKALNGN